VDASGRHRPDPARIGAWLAICAEPQPCRVRVAQCRNADTPAGCGIDNPGGGIMVVMRPAGLPPSPVAPGQRTSSHFR